MAAIFLAPICKVGGKSRWKENTERHYDVCKTMYPGGARTREPGLVPVGGLQMSGFTDTDKPVVGKAHPLHRVSPSQDSALSYNESTNKAAKAHYQGTWRMLS